MYFPWYEDESGHLYLAQMGEGQVSGANAMAAPGEGKGSIFASKFCLALPAPVFPPTLSAIKDKNFHFPVQVVKTDDF